MTIASYLPVATTWGSPDVVITRMQADADKALAALHPVDPWYEAAAKAVMDTEADTETVLVRAAMAEGQPVTVRLRSFEARRMLDGTWQPGQECYATRREIREY